MCQHGNNTKCLVNISAYLSHTGKARWEYKNIDSCLAPIINALNNAGILTANCCCGHGKGDGSIILTDGRELVIKYPEVWP